MLVITTQHKENYGAHDWNGEGECPQRWKFKGGDEIKITDFPSSIKLSDAFGLASDAFFELSDYFEVEVLGVHFEDDSWLSNFEKSQLEYEGFITFKEPTYTFREMLQKAAPAIAFRKEMEEAMEQLA